MANGFGSLYVGASGLQSSQNALNVVANNLANVNTKGYVRQQVVFADKNYTYFADAAISDQRTGLGVAIGDVVHARDIFLDKAYRSESGRQAFYATSFDAVSEVQTHLQEMDGKRFEEALADLYVAFSEFSKDPSDAVNQNLVLQKSSLFVSRTASLYQGLKNYQSTINTKIRNDVDRVNELGKTIQTLNKEIQRVEAAQVETAMDLRDARDNALDELASLANISVTETPTGIVKVQLEGVQFVDESKLFQIGLQKDFYTGFETPYWTQLSDLEKEDYYYVFKMDNISAENNTDKGEIKALILARGDKNADFRDMEGLTDYEYSTGLANSVMMNAESEIDTLFHSLATAINDALCPNTEYTGAATTGTDAKGNTVDIMPGMKILDVKNCPIGSDKKLPPQELFVRLGSERYTEVTLDDGSKMYLYNEEDYSNYTKCYSVKSVSVNQEMIAEESLIPHMKQNEYIEYDLGAQLEALWEAEDYFLNPSDTTPCTFAGFYVKLIGEIGTVGSVYESTANSLADTRDTIDNNRQGVIGVSSDEELTNMIRYQSAYNASSRYINTVSQMIDHLLTSL